jgi:hypothetical protein
MATSPRMHALPPMHACMHACMQQDDLALQARSQALLATRACSPVPAVVDVLRPALTPSYRAAHAASGTHLRTLTQRDVLYLVWVLTESLRPEGPARCRSRRTCTMVAVGCHHLAHPPRRQRWQPSQGHHRSRSRTGRLSGSCMDAECVAFHFSASQSQQTAHKLCCELGKHPAKSPSPLQARQTSC